MPDSQQTVKIALLRTGLWIRATVFSLVCIILVMAISVPLGIPGDWTWQRRTLHPFPVIDAVFFGIWISLGVLIARFLVQKNRGQPSHLLGIAAMIVCMTLANWSILGAGRLGMSENIRAVMDPWTTGYLEVAEEIESPLAYLRQCALHLEADTQNTNHLDVHPPGNTLLSYCSLKLIQHVPTLRMQVRHVFPVDVSDDAGSQEMRKTLPCFEDTETAFWSAALLVILFVGCATLAAVFICLATVELCRPWKVSPMVLLLLGSIPAPVLFIGHYDVILYFLSGLSAWLLALVAVRASSKSLWLDGLLLANGFLCGIGVFFSVGFGVVIAMIGIVLILMHSSSPCLLARRLGSFLVGGGAVIVIAHAVGVPIVKICFLCMRNNNRFFDEAGRSFWWIAANPLDVLFFFGGPFLVLLMAHWWHRARMCRRPPGPVGAWSRSVALCMLLLLCSPFVRGEAGRLLLVGMPYPLVLCCCELTRRHVRWGTMQWETLSYVVAMAWIFIARVGLSLVLIY